VHHLYHGSFYQTDELKPGLAHTGDLTRWDQTESNAYLYATDDREEAIRQGIASAIEKCFDVDRHHTSATAFEIYYAPDAKRKPTIEAINKLHIYLYTIDFTDHDGWMIVNNQHNGLKDKEYKTLRTLREQVTQRDLIRVGEYLKHHQLKLIEEVPTPSNESHTLYRWMGV
jgi:hypothetical protein